jgi:hypothetical protein
MSTTVNKHLMASGHHGVCPLVRDCMMACLLNFTFTRVRVGDNAVTRQ